MSGILRRMVRRRTFIATLASGLVGTFTRPVVAMASVDPAEAYVTDIADEVMGLANSGENGIGLRNKFASLLNRYINLKGVANYALGTYAPKLPADKREEFYTLVNNYSAALFVYYISDFKGTRLEIMSNAKQGKFITILSAIRRKSGGREQVRWRLTPMDGGFRVTDVNIKGIWLTISMRDRFNKVLKRSRGDFEALFDELREAETW